MPEETSNTNTAEPPRRRTTTPLQWNFSEEFARDLESIATLDAENILINSVAGEHTSRRNVSIDDIDDIALLGDDLIISTGIPRHFLTESWLSILRSRATFKNKSIRISKILLVRMKVRFLRLRRPLQVKMNTFIHVKLPAIFNRIKDFIHHSKLKYFTKKIKPKKKLEFF